VDKTRRAWRPGDAPLSLSDGFGYGPTTGTPATPVTQVTQALRRMRHCETCGGCGHTFDGPLWNQTPTCYTCGGMGMVVAEEAGTGE
jgi:DnaJ-class molecular chaperone